MKAAKEYVEHTARTQMEQNRSNQGEHFDWFQDVAEGFNGVQEPQFLSHEEEQNHKYPKSQIGAAKGKEDIFAALEEHTSSRFDRFQPTVCQKLFATCFPELARTVPVGWPLVAVTTLFRIIDSAQGYSIQQILSAWHTAVRHLKVKPARYAWKPSLSKKISHRQSKGHLLAFFCKRCFLFLYVLQVLAAHGMQNLNQVEFSAGSLVLLMVRLYI
jgi:hypothetical protein